MTTNIILVIVFCLGFVRTLEDDDECIAHSCLLCKTTQTKRKDKERKRVSAHLLAIDAHVIFQSNIFCNSASTTSSTTTFQQCLLQHHFNTDFYNCFYCALILQQQFIALRCCNIATILSCQLQHRSVLGGGRMNGVAIFHIH